MIIKDIIEKLEDMIKKAKTNRTRYRFDLHDGEVKALGELKQWIKSNLEEEQAKYGKDEDDYFESKIAEEREG